MLTCRLEVRGPCVTQLVSTSVRAYWKPGRCACVQATLIKVVELFFYRCSLPDPFRKIVQQRVRHLRSLGYAKRDAEAALSCEGGVPRLARPVLSEETFLKNIHGGSLPSGCPSGPHVLCSVASCRGYHRVAARLCACAPAQAMPTTGRGRLGRGPFGTMS